MSNDIDGLNHGSGLCTRPKPLRTGSRGCVRTPTVILSDRKGPTR
jgi:hypothetical protein